MSKVVTKFVELHSTVSKRQVEMKITELAIKEKRATDTQKVLLFINCYFYYNYHSFKYKF